MDHSSASAEMKVDAPSQSSTRQVRASLSHTADLIQPLRKFLAVRVSPDGPPRIEAVARAAQCSVRTLQRRLGEVGVTYSRLLEDVRLAAAARLLLEADSRVIDIAFDLGYSDQANFTRAFRRWAGVPPSQFRRMRRSEADEWNPLVVPAHDDEADPGLGWSAK